MNVISWKRDENGRRFKASARYAAEVDGWYCSVGEAVEGSTKLFERRGPVNDAFAEVEDMMRLAVDGSYDANEATK